MSEGARVLIGALCATYSPDATERGNAEAALKAMESAPGYLPALLEVSVAGGADRGVRLAAGIALKNAVRRCWGAAEGAGASACVAAADKAAVRGAVLDAMCAAEPLVRKQLRTPRGHRLLCACQRSRVFAQECLLFAQLLLEVRHACPKLVTFLH